MECEDATIARLLPEVGVFWLALTVYISQQLLGSGLSTRWGWLLLFVFGPSLLLLLWLLMRERKTAHYAEECS